MQPPERIETERLILRKPRVDDAPDIFTAYAQDTEVTRYLTWCPHKSVEETYQIVGQMLKHWEAGSAYPYAITRKDSDTLLGMIAMHPDGPKLAIGYVLARPHWGKGYVPEVARAIIDWAFQQPSIDRVYATTDVENDASRRVLEKVGMHCEGILRKYIIHPNISNAPRDSYIYAITK
ncbi:MAG: N-acetyltransferase [Chloroflexi bacterium]|nr:MAG: N-acetyltransferase [Chloroflexota bacterium]